MKKNNLFEEFKGKTVLQIGVLGDFKNYLRPGMIEQWEFYKICKISKKAIAIDILKEGIDAMKIKGFNNIVNANAENFNLNETFDIIYAGDVIEHLNNIGDFLECCKKHMRKNSRLIITTPNPYSIEMILRGIIGKTYGGICYDHTFFLHKRNMEMLAKRFKMQVSTNYFSLPDKRNLVHKLMSFILKTLCIINNQWNQSYLFELKLD